MTIHSADIIQPFECVVHSRRPGENHQTRCREQLESKHIFGAAVELLNLFFLKNICANQNLRDSCTRGGSTHRCKQVFITLKETKERVCVDLIWTFPPKTDVSQGDGNSGVYPRIYPPPPPHMHTGICLKHGQLSCFSHSFRRGNPEIKRGGEKKMFLCGCWLFCFIVTGDVGCLCSYPAENLPHWAWPPPRTHYSQRQSFREKSNKC